MPSAARTSASPSAAGAPRNPSSSTRAFSFDTIRAASPARSGSRRMAVSP